MVPVSRSLKRELAFCGGILIEAVFSQVSLITKADEKKKKTSAPEYSEPLCVIQ